jgi:signal peptidase I
MNAELTLAPQAPVPPSVPAARINRKSVPATAVIVRSIFSWLATVGLAVASYFLISRYVLQIVEVQGASMVPTLHNSDRYYLKRWIYYTRSPERGDVVVIKDPTDGTFAVKRIIALAGESIFLKNGVVYVNGRPLKEPYLSPGTSTFTCNTANAEMITCGRNRYFVLGDNRGNSFDSRFYGPIPRENILGAIAP